MNIIVLTDEEIKIVKDALKAHGIHKDLIKKLNKREYTYTVAKEL